MKQALFIISILLSCICCRADFSYIYIQGDKKTPIYVKFEDQMIPRYGKNYSIISRLAPGLANIEILFQQNVFPPQKFVVKVPENGYRGFLLVQNNDIFSLYDIHNKYYIPAGNQPEDDMLKSDNTEKTYFPETREPVKKPAITKNASNGKTHKKPVIKPAVKPAQKNTASAKHTEPAGPQFIPDIELNHSKTVQPQGNLPEEQEEDNRFRNAVAVVNSDCPKAISNSKFETIYKKASGKSGTDRLKYLMDELDNCYTANQVRILTRTLKTDAERFTFLKNAYPRTTDQSVFIRLENTLTTEDWKKDFRNLVSNTN